MKRTVCIAVHAFPHEGGINSIVVELIRHFSRENRVVVFTAGGGSMKRIVGVESLGPDVSIVNFAPRGWIGKYVAPWSFPFALVYAMIGFIQLWLIHRREKFALIMAQDGAYTGLFSVLVGRIAGVRTVVMDHGIATNLYGELYWKLRQRHGWRAVVMPAGAFRLTSRAVIRRTAALADELLLCGHEPQRLYRETLHMPASMVKVYRHLIDTELYTPPSDGSARRALAIPADSFVVNMVTRLSTEKGLETALPALIELAKRHPGRMRVIIAGDGSLRGEVESWIRNSGVAEVFSMVGHVDRARTALIYQASDVHLYTGTMGSNVSIALLEAMACGCVPVATNVPRMHEQILDGSNGIVVPCDDQRAVIAAIERLMSLDLQPVREKARAYVMRNHAYQAAAEDFQHL